MPRGGWQLPVMLLGASGAAATVALRRPEPTVRALARLLPIDALCYVDTKTPVFALTFDDGPHPKVTPLLLDVLARHRARATFFLTGERLAGAGPVLARMAAEGHELANHLMRDEPSVLLSAPQFRLQLAEVNTFLAPYGEVRWFRPGSGWLTPGMNRAAARQDLRCVLGSVVARHDGGPGDQRIAARLLSRVRPGSIVVLHEGTADRRGVIETTERVLAELTRRGLAAVTVSDLVAAGGRSPDAPVSTCT